MRGLRQTSNGATIEAQTPPLMRLCMATMTFSSAVMLWKSLMFWNVRAIPSLVT
jgi:hypothetical protein